METVTTHRAEPIIQLLKMQQGYFNKALAEVKENDATRRLNGHTNHMAWLTGHVVSCRYMLAGMLGLEEQEPFPDYFGGLQGIKEEDYPTLTELQKDMPAITHKLTERIAEMSEEDLNADFQHGGRLIDLILFFVYHEAYHIGQIGILRKYWGYPALDHRG